MTSPFKTNFIKKASKIEQSNQYSNSKGPQVLLKSQKKSSNTLRVHGAKAQKQERSQQRPQINSIITTSQSFQVKREYDIDEGKNSKSPNKKSIQLQQILKSIHLKTTQVQQYSQNRNQNTVTPNTSDKNTRKNQIAAHNHTKSYQQLVNSQTNPTGNSTQIANLKSAQINSQNAFK